MMFLFAYPQMASFLKVREAVQILGEKSGIDIDMILKSAEDVAAEQEAAQQNQNPMLVAQLEKIAAEIDKIRAQAAATMVGAETTSAKTEIDQARAQREFEQTLLPPVVKAPAEPKPPKAGK